MGILVLNFLIKLIALIKHFIIDVPSSCVLFWNLVRAVRPLSSSRALTSAPSIAADRLRHPRSPPIASGALYRRRSHTLCHSFLLLLLPPPPSIGSHLARVAAPDLPTSLPSFPERTPPFLTREATSSSSKCINFFMPDLRCKCLAISNLCWSLMLIVPIGIGFD